MISTDSHLSNDIVLLDSSGNKISSAELSRGVVVLYFYPRAMTPGCTREGKRFNELYEEFAKLGVKIYGVSTDKPERNKRFAEKYGFKFKLLSDPDGKVIGKLGFMKKGTKRPTSQRVTLILKDGEVIAVLRNIRPAERHADEALKIIKKLLKK